MTIEQSKVVAALDARFGKGACKLEGGSVVWSITTSESKIYGFESTKRAKLLVTIQADGSQTYKVRPVKK